MLAKVLGGAGRIVGNTLRSAVTDVATTAAHLAELTTDRLARRDSDDAVLRVAVVILSNADGPLCQPGDVTASLDRAQQIFQQAGIRVRPVSIRVVAGPAPEHALRPRANQKLLLDDLLGRTEWYRRFEPGEAGIGSPVTVVVVEEIAGRTTGCSLGMTADWVVCQASLFNRGNPHTYDETVLAHELGHALNLPHHKDNKNLMFPSSSPPDQLRGTELQSWQKLVLGGNRHVIPGLRGRPGARHQAPPAGDAQPGTERAEATAE